MMTATPPDADQAVVVSRGDVAATVGMVGTYPPTQCGIATYTANLGKALESCGVGIEVVRLIGRDEDPGPRRDEVVALWPRGCPVGFDAAVAATEGVDAVLLQHEFGIYSGPDGSAAADFVQACTRPIVTVLHTVLANPRAGQVAIIAALDEASEALVVHTDAARARLVAVHDIDPVRVVVIPHGAAANLTGSPLIVSTEPLMLTWGLLGPGKGIEHGIDAIALLRDRGLEVRYLVAGETHPNVRARHGEEYRDDLRDRARRRGVSDLVDFDDRYRDHESLQAMVRSATLVLLPYDARDQVTSGVLVEALAAGKPVVSTEFPHAIELQPCGAVALVHHRSSSDISRAVNQIVTQPQTHSAMETAAVAEGAKYDWPIVGRRFAAVLADAMDPLISPGAGGP